jgi:hypothetical protein
MHWPNSAFRLMTARRLGTENLVLRVPLEVSRRQWQVFPPLEVGHVAS